MLESDQEIVNELGLHARPAAKLVHLAAGFRSRVTIALDGEEVDAKSILGLLLLSAAKGTVARIRCDGDDEAEAMAAIVTLFQSGFEEERR